MDTNTQVLKDADHLQTFIAVNELVRIDGLYELDEDSTAQWEEGIWYSPHTKEFILYGEVSDRMETFGDYWINNKIERGNLLWACKEAWLRGYNEERFAARLKELVKTGIIS